MHRPDAKRFWKEIQKPKKIGRRRREKRKQCIEILLARFGAYRNISIGYSSKKWFYRTYHRVQYMYMYVLYIHGWICRSRIIIVIIIPEPPYVSYIFIQASERASPGLERRKKERKKERKKAEEDE